ncbi:MAG TPA: hypothetical protein VNN76_02185 [Bacteroidota bacterium]|nr:hypothetical protein [Bacteroidota bacterium]
MDTERFYRAVYYAGSGWNFLASVPTFFLVGILPAMLQIDPPLYPIFIYFNLMTMFLFGCIQFTVARNLSTSRPYVKILIWSKLLTVGIFMGGFFLLSIPRGLIEFLAPGMFLDLIFGILFWCSLRVISPTISDLPVAEAAAPH